MENWEKSSVNCDGMSINLISFIFSRVTCHIVVFFSNTLNLFFSSSSQNAKKWEVELQTLKNNNARLTTALQESTINVEEWKKQLASYKEENANLKKMVCDGSDM